MSRVSSCLVAVGVLIASSCGQSAPAGQGAGVSATVTEAVAPLGSLNQTSIPYTLIAEDIAEGDPWSAALIETRRDFASLELPIPFDDELLDLSFQSHVILTFNVAESSSTNCAVGPMSDLVFDATIGVLAPVFGTLQEEDQTCNMDANAHLVVVSVRRLALPESAFTLWVLPSIPPEGLSEGAETVNPEELKSAFPALEFNGPLAVGETKIAYGATTHCGIDPLTLPIAGRQWMLVNSSHASGIDRMPEGWTSQRNGFERIDLVIERTGTDLLTVTELGSELSLQYIPVPEDEIAGCD